MDLSPTIPISAAGLLILLRNPLFITKNRRAPFPVMEKALRLFFYSRKKVL